MRILHITERYGNSSIGGAQLSVASLAHAQAAVDHNHHIGVLFIGEGSETVDNTQTDVELIRIGESWSCRQLRKSRPNRLVNAATYLYEGNIRGCSQDVIDAIDCFRPDIINTHTIFGINEDVWRLAYQRGVPIIHSIRDYYLICARATLLRYGKTCSKPCLECRMITARRQRSIRYLSGLVTVSESLLSTHRKFVDISCPTSVIGCPISPDLCASPRSTPQIIAGRPFTFGFIGRLVPEKGIEALIAAFKCASLDNAELLIAGEGAEYYVDSLRAILPPTGVRLVGRVDAKSFYGATDVVVVPSIWGEPFGRVAAEAMLSGVPVICSNRGVFPELLNRYHCGLLVDPDDTPRFAQALANMRNDYQTYWQPAAQAQPRAAEDLSEARIALSYLDFYAVIGRSRA